jgi:eukaryotic-like serine/threonine-protein kinase
MDKSKEFIMIENIIFLMPEFKSGVFDEKYKILELIGEGGSALVYKTRTISNDNYVALKKYSTSLEPISDMERLRREIRIMSLINHENVIQILDYNLETPSPYIIMPLAKCSLEELIPDLIGDEERILKLFLQACEGVKKLHECRIYHRDIKASNILISQDDKVLITDLGIAKFRDRDTPTLTGPEDLMGTEVYTPPEYYSPDGCRNGDERGDIFQLGKTLYNLLTGKTPGILDLELISPGLQIIVSKATRNIPNERYKSVEELIKAIKSYLDALKPDSNPKDICEYYLGELIKSSITNTYDSDMVENTLIWLYSCKGDEQIFIDLFDKIPLNVLKNISKGTSIPFEMIIKEYILIMDKLTEDFYQNFAYADVIAKRMEILYKHSSDIQHKTTALRIILKTSVAANRYSAMNTFIGILKNVKDSNEGSAISIMLNEEIKYFSMLIKWSRVEVPVDALNYSLRHVRKLAENFSDI